MKTSTGAKKKKGLTDISNGGAPSDSGAKKRKLVVRPNLDKNFFNGVRTDFASLMEGAPSSGDARCAFLMRLVDGQRGVMDDLTKELNVFELRSFPAATAEEIVSEICVFLLMNFDVPTNHPGNGVTNPKNGCASWLRQGQWTAFAKRGFVSVDDAGAMPTHLRIIDRIPLFVAVTADGPDAELVRVLEAAAPGDAKKNAERLLHRYYVFVMGIFELNASARGAPARIVGVGEASSKLCDRFWSTLSSVDVIGCIMHPDAWFRFPHGTVTAEQLASSRAILERDAHTTLDSVATAVALACGVTLLAGPIVFFQGVFDKVDSAALDLALDARKTRGRAWWDALTPQQQLDRMQGAWDGRDDWWDALSETERRDKVKLMLDGRDDWFNGLSETARQARRDDISSKMIGNTNNTRSTTEHTKGCPNPNCPEQFHTTDAHASRAFQAHFRRESCRPCVAFVRAAIKAGDPHGVLWGWRPGFRSKWPKWISPPKKK